MLCHVERSIDLVHNRAPISVIQQEIDMARNLLRQSPMSRST